MKLGLIKIFCWLITFSALAVITIDDTNDHIPDRFQKIVLKKLKKQFPKSNINISFNEELSLKVDSTYYIPYFNIQNEVGDTLGYFVFKTTKACQFGGCISDREKSRSLRNDFYDKIHYYVILNRQFEIQHIQVIEHESEYGIEIAAKYWLKQFFNQTPGSFKLDQNIDGISGATISVEAMITDLNLMAPME